ncbi:MAG: hypothetical protein A2Y89_00105 [Chloroflexi bacterium RBG_13_51_18]|nr:MAG: hypothetical protein A2Y89_00105 [Chloroflexi bacterium RBG_13_51_18]
MRRILLILCILIIGLMPFLSACDSGEAQDLIYWAKLWAIVHDITDTDGNPNYGAVTRFAVGEAFGLGSTGDEEGDAAIDAARVLNNMRQAEESADQGWEALNKGKNIKQSVLPHFNKAIDLRPDDWSYRNGRGIANLEDLENPDNAKAARDDFNQANEIAKRSGKPAEYLRMLRNREQALARLVAIKNDEHAFPTKEVYLEQSRTYDELYKLTGEKSYLLLKQQADTNIQEGHYWVRD